MASEDYYKGLVKKDYYTARSKDLRKKYKKKRAARGRGSNTVDLIKAADKEERENLKKLRAERKRLNELIDEHGKDAPRVRSFMTPAYKGEEISDYELMMKLKRQENKADVPDEELSAQELYERRQRNKASGGSVKGRPAKRSAEN